MDYSTLSEITVKTQVELDAIPLDFKGRIYIDGGTPYARIIVTNKYLRSVEAWGNSSVVAWGNSSVEANANTQVVDRTFDHKIKISGTARIVYMPKSIVEFCDFYGIKHTKTKAIFYKAVRKDKDIYYSDHTPNFKYAIGQVQSEKCDDNKSENCGQGIHIAHLNWALNYGVGWDNLAILEVETKLTDIVLSNNSDGKVRTSQVKVLREVPLEECGVYGKIIEKRRVNKC